MSGENLVDIDRAALAAEVASVELPAEPVAPPAEGGELAPTAPAELTLEQVQAAASAWRGGAEFAVNALSDAIAPNWAITAEERSKLIDSIAMALAAWFPDGAIPLKYLVLLNVGGAMWGIVTARRDANGGKLPPLRLEKPKPEGSSAPRGQASIGAMEPSAAPTPSSNKSGHGATTSV